MYFFQILIARRNCTIINDLMKKYCPNVRKELLNPNQFYEAEKTVTVLRSGNYFQTEAGFTWPLVLENMMINGKMVLLITNKDGHYFFKLRVKLVQIKLC